MCNLKGQWQVCLLIQMQQQIWNEFLIQEETGMGHQEEMISFKLPQPCRTCPCSHPQCTSLQEQTHVAGSEMQSLMYVE